LSAGKRKAIMHPQALAELIGNTDIYLVDQILKGRYGPGDRVLDAGCGHGRNLHWFLANDIDVYGTDRDALVIDELRTMHPESAADRFKVCPVEQMPFPDDFFDHVISSAVLHFAKNPAHFLAMFGEMVRVLRPGGSLFIRMASDIGIADRIQPLGDGVYLIPDGSERFLLNRWMVQTLPLEFGLTVAEPFKTVNVDDQRCMSTWVLLKNS
jgi:ubiquinone/menaquinone biosynthesis C-methylase UbiE